jgi:hypothetical protein
MSGHKNFNGPHDKLRGQPDYRGMLQHEHDAHQRGLLDAVVTLTRLREARGVTQLQVADAWGSTQANVSQVKRTPDIYLSTLRSYVEALGGHLDVSAVFPDETSSLLGAAELLSGEAESTDEALTG